jgi:uncharacterized membrane protein HdeD (DUF308 family)
MIITLFILGLISVILGVWSGFKKKAILAFFFIFMGIVLVLVGWVVVYLYPHTLPW